MPMGDDEMGELELGADFDAEEVDPRQPPPAAIHFDPRTRTFTRDENGHYQAIHPVDAAVASALHFEFGRVPTVPNKGRKLADIRNPTSNTTGAVVRDRVHVALDRLLRKGDITIHSIKHESPNRGALFVEVVYFNERLKPREKKTATAQTM